MITAFATTETAITAMKQGAYDYVTKPFKVDELRLVVEKALEKRLLAAENQRLRSELRKETRRRQLVGNSRAMEQLYELVARVADTKTNVLVCGESGTGKELVARAIHDQSERREQPFVAVNCGAIPENLLESELFGHVKGAFTGRGPEQGGPLRDGAPRHAVPRRDRRAAGSLQVKLLRVIQDKALRRVGGTSRPPRWTCASSPPPTAGSRTRSPRAASARISTTG